MKYNPGDTVKVVGRVSARVSWNDRMNATIGKQGIVMDNSGGSYRVNERCHVVMFEDYNLNMNTEWQRYWVYSEESLELVEDVPPLKRGHAYGLNVHVSQELPP